MSTKRKRAGGGDSYANETTPRKTRQANEHHTAPPSGTPPPPDNPPTRRSGRPPKPKNLDAAHNGLIASSPSHVDSTPRSQRARREVTQSVPSPKTSRRPRKAPLHTRNGSAHKNANRRSPDIKETQEPEPAPDTDTAAVEDIGTNGVISRDGAGNLADRSARRKSARRLMEPQDSDDELGEEADFARRILNDDESEEVGSDGEEEEDEQGDETIRVEARSTPLETPSKRSRGRPKGSKNRRTPTPPRNLPPYEYYFFQNRPGASKTSTNTLHSSAIPSHEDYYNAIRRYADPHRNEIGFLQNLHERAFHQWTFELEQGFSVCLHGWGSKHSLLQKFARYTYEIADAAPIVVIINGYESDLSLRQILNVVATTIPALTGRKTLGAQPADALTTILDTVQTSPPAAPITLVISSLDAPGLRRTTTQALLARLANSPHFRVIASCDTPHFGLLWDTNARAQFNFVFHDATTFIPLEREINGSGSGGVVDEVLALLGRSGRRVQGKEGVVFVLRSLTESARRLFALLIAEVLAMETMQDDVPATHSGTFDEEQHEDEVEGDTQENRHDRSRRSKQQTGGALGGGIEYRTLYRKAVQQLITGNEISFGQLLKEFYDHQMVVSRRDGAGTEMLSVPFRREECEAILEDLVLDS